MVRLRHLKSALVGGASVLAIAHPAAAKEFDVPGGDLAAALTAYMQQAGVELVYIDNVVQGHKSRGAKGDYTETAALTQLLRGTGFTAQPMPMSNAIGIVPQKATPEERIAQAGPRTPAPAPAQTGVETVVVTAQHKSENIQQVPIAVTALSQRDLTERQIAGGPDLVKEVPNLTFSKTNFSGYNLEIRGIGTQAISVTTDPAVAVAFNDTPFIRNHFFEQEFYDLQDAEVLRGPQGTLYGRNATAGVVNIKSALPTDQYEAMLSADMGNYNNRRLEAMINLPIVGDQLDIRIAGEWTKRDGYTNDTSLNTSVDGRDLWSGRITIGWKPASNIQTYLVWEHFSEDDDRLRSGKQLCQTAPTPTEVGGVAVTTGSLQAYEPGPYLSQGCLPGSLYSPSSYGVPNGQSLPYYEPLGNEGVPVWAYYGPFDPYASQTQSTNLRDIESSILPTYRAKNDTLELNTNYDISHALTLTSQTGFNNDFLWSTEDYYRFDTTPGAFFYTTPQGDAGFSGDKNATGIVSPDPNGQGRCRETYNGLECAGQQVGSSCTPLPAAYVNTEADDQLNPGEGAGYQCIPDGVFCDPQLGCSDRLVAEDLSEERAWQFSQELRFASHYDGPFNFSVGGNFLHYETVEDYYVFINTLTMAAYDWTQGTTPTVFQTLPWEPGVSDNSNCLAGGYGYPNFNAPGRFNTGVSGPWGCMYIDPNPIGSLNNEGHNYFLSQNPYVLNSYALFGESYYDITPDLKFTSGLRWTDDQKHFLDIPSELLIPGYGYPVTGIVNQSWERFTGRAALDWSPQLDFTDQTLLYASYAHGYKAGGANPPGAALLTFGNIAKGNGGGDEVNPIHPLTFKPEYIESFELGTKNTLLDGQLTIDGDVFYYNYTGYQISEIVDRTAINNNYNAHVEGAELESNWEPLPGLKFAFEGGFENSGLAGGTGGVDLLDRADLANHPGWMVVKPFVTQTSNCVLPVYVVTELLQSDNVGGSDAIGQACAEAYSLGYDPVTERPYVPNPTLDATHAPISGYAGFNPATAPNDGQGFDKNLSGNQLPNAPHFTTSLSAEYTMPVTADWAATLHTDLYWQSQQWARVFDDPIDKIHGYSNVNVALTLTSDNGWQVMAYVKNVFDVTAITGTFLNSDDSGLTTNVFLTDPRLFGVRVTKQLDSNDGFWGGDYNGADFFSGVFSDTDNGKPPLWIELGGQLNQLEDPQATFSQPLMNARPAMFTPSQKFEKPPLLGLDETAKVSFQPDDSDWVFSASVRYGRTSKTHDAHQQTNPKSAYTRYQYAGYTYKIAIPPQGEKFADTYVRNSQRHAIMDFEAGKDIGLGLFGGDDASSVLSGGLRFAQFQSKTNIALKSDPDFHFRYWYFTAPQYNLFHIKHVSNELYHSNAASFSAKRSFHGLGPKISWNASQPFAGNTTNGEWTFDWGANAAVLFGRQRTHTHHQATGSYNTAFNGFYQPVHHITYQAGPFDHSRSRMVAVPNLGGFVGLSMKYNNAKVSFGYRADEFFGAMDGGIDSYKAENRGFFGPFANISIGLGG